MEKILFILVALIAMSELRASDQDDLSLEDLMAVDVFEIASNVNQSIHSQPVSISVIYEHQLKLSGARTLNEALQIFVPGFYLVRDHDDDIAGFRGYAPDNNSKVLFLIDGHNLNTEWFWGPPDSILNGMNLDFIQRVEVIRGPGSVTHGGGALLGVINIVSKFQKPTNSPNSVKIESGSNNYTSGSAEFYQNENNIKVYTHLYSGEYQGQSLRHSGWADLKTWSGSTPGDDVASSGLRLNNSKARSAIARVQGSNLNLTILHHDQQRHLFNFYRDRSIVQQALTSAMLSYRKFIDSKSQIDIKLSHTFDDYGLLSLGGISLGGTREVRTRGQLIFKNKAFLTNRNSLAMGAEFNHFKNGLANRQGNNFISNLVDEALLSNPNAEKAYVYPDESSISAIFLENYYEFTSKTQGFFALRMDHHPFWNQNTNFRLGLIHQSTHGIRNRLSLQSGFRGAPGISYTGGFRSDGFLSIKNYNKIGEASNGRESNIAPVVPEKMLNLEWELSYLDASSPWKLTTTTFVNRISNTIDVGVIYSKEGDIQTIGDDIVGDWNGYWYYKNNPGVIQSMGNETTISYSRNNHDLSMSHSTTKIIDAPDQDVASMYLTSGNHPHFKGFPQDVTRINYFYNQSKNISYAANYYYDYRWYSPENTIGKGNHLLNLGISWNFRESFEWGATIHNTLNSLENSPMISNVGGTDLSPGTPNLEKRSYVSYFTVAF